MGNIIKLKTQAEKLFFVGFTHFIFFRNEAFKDATILSKDIIDVAHLVVYKTFQLIVVIIPAGIITEFFI